MRYLLFFVMTVCLIILSGCDKAEVNKDWVHYSNLDFPVYVGHFADYVNTNENGNILGDVQYGEHGNTYDWEILEYHGNEGSDKGFITGLNIPRFEPGNPSPAIQVSGNKCIPTSKNFTAEGFIEPGIPELIDPDSTGIFGTFTLNTPSVAEVPTTPVVQYSVYYFDPVLPVELSLKSGIYYCSFVINLSAQDTTAHTQMTVSFPSGEWYMLAFYNGSWHDASTNPVNNSGTVIWDDLPFTDDVQLAFSYAHDPHIEPPIITPFETCITAEYHVQLEWASDETTGQTGYNIYRSATNVLADAVKINPNLITSGTSQPDVVLFNYIDENVLLTHTYYYWLERIDTSNNSYFRGPVYATVVYTGSEPILNKIYPAYPNPCTSGITLPFSLTESADTHILILNQQHTVVLDFQDNKGRGSNRQYVDMSGLPAGLYRVYYWIKMQNKTYYSYGDVLKSTP